MDKMGITLMLVLYYEPIDSWLPISSRNYPTSTVRHNIASLQSGLKVNENEEQEILNFPGGMIILKELLMM